MKLSENDYLIGAFTVDSLSNGKNNAGFTTKLSIQSFFQIIQEKEISSC